MIFNKSDLSTVINLVLQNRDPEKLINGMDQIFNTNNNLSKFKEFSIDEQNNIFKLIKNIAISVNNPKISSIQGLNHSNQKKTPPQLDPIFNYPLTEPEGVLRF